MERSAWPKSLSSSRKRAIQELCGQNPKKLRDAFDAHSQTGDDPRQPLFAGDLIVSVLGSFSSNTQSLSSGAESYEGFQVPSNAFVNSEVSEGSESITSPLESVKTPVQRSPVESIKALDLWTPVRPSRSNAEANEDAREANAAEEEEEENDEDDVAFKKEKVTLVAMESRDPYENFLSMGEMVEVHGIKNDEDDVAFKKEKVTLLAMESRDPYEDFRMSMEEMVEVHGIKGDDWECLAELLCWYLRVNDRDNHGYIYAAAVNVNIAVSQATSLRLYNSSLSSASSSSLSACCVSISEAEETISMSTSCSLSSAFLEVVEDEGQSFD